MDNMAIIVRNVTKKFGNVTVLDNVSLQVKKGTICGIIGRNGSGKTVLFKCICGLLQINEGSILVDKKEIGAIIEEQDFSSSIRESRILDYLHQCREKKI